MVGTVKLVIGLLVVAGADWVGATPKEGGVNLALPRAFAPDDGATGGREEGEAPPPPPLTCQVLVEPPPTNAPPMPEAPNELELKIRAQPLLVRCSRVLTAHEKQRLGTRLKRALTLNDEGPLTVEIAQPILDATVRRLGRDFDGGSGQSSRRRAFGGVNYGVRGVRK